MTKKLFILALIAFFLPAFCSADFNVAEWKYYKKIENIKAGYNVLSIDDELFKNSEKDLRDLRIINSGGQEAPYKLRTSQSSLQTVVLRPKLLNNSYIDEENSSVILDFGENNQGVNSLDIKTDSENFQTGVRVSGSDEMGDWRILKEGIYIYDYTDRRAGVKTQATSINFPENIFRYLKIDILDSAVIINSVTGEKTVKESVKELVRDPDFKQVKNDKTSEIIVDLGQSGIPTERLALSAGARNFNRAIAIYASFNNEDWRQIGYGYIFRYDTAKFKGENLTLAFPEVNERYLKLVINNQDNEPIVIDRVRTFSAYREVVFEAEPDMAYSAYYGNPQADWPRYDLEKYFQYLDLSGANQSGLGSEAANPDYINTSAPPQLPKSETASWLLPSVFLLACLLLLLLIISFFRKE